MTVEILARLQFALTISFHYIFPPLSIGLAVLLVLMEGTYMVTKDERYLVMCRFWTKIFGLVFAIGVATGIVMEFEFGTNWATYSRFVGDVFGSGLAAEGLFAFFLESGFLAIVLFGWNKVSKGMHFFATTMVCVGTHFSAVWIVVVNSWMQTPAGFHLESEGKWISPDTLMTVDNIWKTRAVIEDFWAMVFNPSSMERLAHVILAAWLTGAFMVLSIGAYYVLKDKFRDFGVRSMKIALAFATVTIILQVFSGDDSARGVAENQPLKLAAMEGLFHTQAHAPLSLIGWVDVDARKVNGLEIPGLLSFLVYHDTSKVVKGLNDFPEKNWPKVKWVYVCYRLMLMMAGIIVLLCGVGMYLWWRKELCNTDKWYVRWYLWGLVFGVAAPQIANQAGWFTAELGRQPWIVYGILRTSDALSKSVTAGQILFSIILFLIVYSLLFVLFVYLLHQKIQHGPGDGTLVKKLTFDWRKSFRANID